VENGGDTTAEAQRARVAELEAAVADREATAEAQSARIAELEAVVADRDAKGEAWRARVARLEAVARERDATVEAQNARVEAWRARFAQFVAAIKDRVATGEAQCTCIEAQSARFVQVAATIKDRDVASLHKLVFDVAAIVTLGVEAIPSDQVEVVTDEQWRALVLEYGGHGEAAAIASRDARGAWALDPPTCDGCVSAAVRIADFSWRKFPSASIFVWDLGDSSGSVDASPENDAEET